MKNQILIDTTDSNTEVVLTMYQKETGYRPKRCKVVVESPVSTDFVALEIDGERYEYSKEMEWSEEDEKMYKNLLFLMLQENSQKSWEGTYEWLTNLRQRILQ